MARRPNRRRNRQRNRNDIISQDINNPDMGSPQRLLPYNPGGRPNYSFNDPVMPDNTTMMPGGKPGMGGRPNYQTLGPDNMPGRPQTRIPGYNPAEFGEPVARTMDLRPGDKGYDPSFATQPDPRSQRQINRQQRQLDRFVQAQQQFQQQFQPQSPAAPQAPQGVDLYGNPLGPVQPQMNQGPLRNLRPQGPDNMPGMQRTYGSDNMPGMQQQMPYQQMPYQQSPYQMYGGFGGPQMGYGQPMGNPMFAGIASMPMQFGGGMTGAQYGQSMMGGRGKGGGGSPQQQSPFGQPMMGGRGKGGGGYSPYM